MLVFLYLLLFCIMKKTLICLLGLTFVGCNQVAEPVEEAPAVDVEVVVPVEIDLAEVPEAVEVPAPVEIPVAE